MEKYKIEPNSVQETLLVPLVGRKIAGEKYPELINDPTAAEIMKRIDYDFDRAEAGMDSFMGCYGALEAAQRVYDLECEAKEYLKDYPEASVVNMGCGLDDLFSRVNNGRCMGYNLDFPDNIEVRNALLPPMENEENIPCDLNDTSWFERIEKKNGVIFIACGVFYYFTRENAEKLIKSMAEYFSGGTLLFDSCNSTGLKMMLGTWIKQAEIKDVKAYFGVADPQKELVGLSAGIKSVSSKSYMKGYRELNGLGAGYRLLNWVADHVVKMTIIKISFS